MKRRTFVSSIAAPALLAVAARSEGQDAGSQAAAPEYYLWRQYVLRNGTEPQRLADFVQNAAIPALNRLGHNPIGVFSVVTGIAGPTLFVMTPLPTLESLAKIEPGLADDEEFRRAGAAYLDATAADPAYIRQENTLLAAFPKFPRIAVPAATASKGPRLFELRTYESPSEKAHLAKVRMFSEMGEIEIFKRLGLTPVFFSRTLVGPRMPSLMYMLVYDDLAAREKGWAAFRDDPEWKKLSSTPGYSDADIVSNITSVYLRPTPYSQI